MITEIPTADDFQTAGFNQIYLAWQIAMQTTGDFEHAKEITYEMNEQETAEASTLYWLKTQPVLANAFGLVQQAMEMALKGRIAEISPYLLIARDPKDWPSGVETKAVSFSAFRTLDAADLIKVHNTFAKTPLSDEFRGFWDEVRRDRNKLMHSVSTKTFDTALLIRSILSAVEVLFSDIKWPKRLLDMEADGKYAAYGLGVDDDRNVVMDQIDRAIRHLTPAESKRFLGFDPKRRSYVCPECWGRANRDWQSDWPSLAQLVSKRRGESTLSCVVCEETIEVERRPCINPKCNGTVVHEETCLTCLWSQDTPDDFPSGLHSDDKESGRRYTLKYKGSSPGTYSTELFPDDAAAIEHARRAMQAPYLLGWKSVILEKEKGGFGLLDRDVIGTWVRETEGLVWHPGESPHSSLY